MIHIHHASSQHHIPHLNNVVPVFLGWLICTPGPSCFRFGSSFQAESYESLGKTQRFWNFRLHKTQGLHYYPTIHMIFIENGAKMGARRPTQLVYIYIYA